MKQIAKRGRRGQALLLVTFSLFAMCGLLGLAVDLGWSYFVKKSAQNAADAAALAAAYQALQVVGETQDFSSSDKVATASSPSQCNLSLNLSIGCQYARQNGFTPGGRQNVTLEAGINSRPNDCTTPPCVTADYWVTARTAEFIPQLFSAVLGNSTALSSARATAAAVQTIVNGSLITLNRKLDPGPDGTIGIDLSAVGGTAPSGIVVSSDLATAISSSGITGPVIARTPGQTSLADGPLFLDPLRGFGQPPLPTSFLPTFAVIGGTLSGTIYEVKGKSPIRILSLGASAVSLPSGNYFNATGNGSCGLMPCTIDPQPGNLIIGPGATVTFSDGSFGTFILWGGLSVSGQMIMDPGEYVVVGGGSGSLFVDNRASMTSTGNTGAGQLLILTGSSGDITYNPDGSVAGNANGDLYPGLVNQINGPSNINLAMMQLAGFKSTMAFGSASITSGIGPAGASALTGLDPTKVPPNSGLTPFAGLVLWQDQANSNVIYNPDGNVRLCGSTFNDACPRTNLPSSNSPELTITATVTGLQGIIYQPRGAWIRNDGGGITGPLQIITGAVSGGALNLSQPPIRLRRRVVALIE